MSIHTDAIIWAGILAFAVIIYVILDGFDLGIGILYLWFKDKHERDILMNSVAPVWDGNETWLVFGGAILYGAFPVAYATLLPILYTPILLMLSALVFRGVAFEFRFKADTSRPFWDVAFIGGSLLAAFCQGVVLGTFVHGYGFGSIRAQVEYYAWLSPFSIMTGLGVACGYALLGATWLIMKTEGDMQIKARKLARIFFMAMLAFIAIVTIWSPLAIPFIHARWFSEPNIFYLAPLPVITALACGYAVYSLYHADERAPFIISVVIFLLFYVGLAISVWPYIIPHQVTIFDAITNKKALHFLSVAVFALLPLLLIYTAYAYYVFRGKVHEHTGYHH
ncbi:MAG: cytochrome d ubiquinol oxidase subunit II [Gammaproteobacteria bacterium]